MLTPQTGIGAGPDSQAALVWYKKAAEGGDKRAVKRLASGSKGRSTVLDRRLEMEALKEEHRSKGSGSGSGGSSDKGDNCVIM